MGGMEAIWARDTIGKKRINKSLLKSEFKDLQSNN